MNWIDIKKQLPQKHLHSMCLCNMDDTTSILVFGYDHINFSPRYQVMYVDTLAEAKPNEDGKYIINELMITHWQHLERPL